MKRILSRIDKLTLISRCVKAATAIVGGSLILSEGHPYLSVGILAVGAIANEVLVFLKKRETGSPVTPDTDVQQ